MHYTKAMQQSGFPDYDTWEAARYKAGCDYMAIPFNTPENKKDALVAGVYFHNLARMGDNN